jgi:hypothetical protein
MTEFINGHISGCLSLENNKTYLVRFEKEKTKRFPVTKYENLELAKEAAIKYQKEVSDLKGLTKNKYRFIDGYIEFQLFGGLIGKIDIIDINLLLEYIWHSKKSFKRFYIATHYKKSQKYIHNLICPQWKQVDHINRDGLDNRRCNLRDGCRDNINVKNQSKRTDNKSGKTGVSYSTYNNTWVIQWPENGKRKIKRFSVSKYGDIQAKQLAIEFRVKLDEKLGIENGYESDCENKEEIIPEIVIEKFTPKLVTTNTSGIHGVSLSTNKLSWVAYWTVNGKRKSKSFSIKKHGNEEAKEMARKTREEADPRLRT